MSLFEECLLYHDLASNIYLQHLHNAEIIIVVLLSSPRVAPPDGLLRVAVNVSTLSLMPSSVIGIELETVRSLARNVRTTLVEG